MYKHVESSDLFKKKKQHFIENTQNGFMPVNKHLCHKTLFIFLF